jgi:hypothetical protein
MQPESSALLWDARRVAELIREFVADSGVARLTQNESRRSKKER